MGKAYTFIEALGDRLDGQSSIWEDHELPIFEYRRRQNNFLSSAVIVDALSAGGNGETKKS